MDNLVLWIQGKSFTPDNMEEFNNIYLQYVLFSYKKNFISIDNTNITNDTGWGCMLRCSQMILYQSISILLNINENDDTKLKLIQLFHDNKDAPYSIHNLCQKKQQLNIDITEWIGPHMACHLLKYVFSTSIYSNQLDIEITQNSIINKKLEMIKPTILFIPIRLGNILIEEKYYHHLYYLFTFTNFMGFIGGNNRSAYYFIGIDSNLDLYYLDPHSTQDLRNDTSIVYNPETVQKINISTVDANLSLCFTINNNIEYQNICNLFEKQIKLPIDVLETEELDEINFNENDEWLMLE